MKTKANQLWKRDRLSLQTPMEALNMILKCNRCDLPLIDSAKNLEESTASLNRTEKSLKGTFLHKHLQESKILWILTRKQTKGMKLSGHNICKQSRYQTTTLMKQELRPLWWLLGIKLWPWETEVKTVVWDLLKSWIKFQNPVHSCQLTLSIFSWYLKNTEIRVNRNHLSHKVH